MGISLDPFSGQNDAKTIPFGAAHTSWLIREYPYGEQWGFFFTGGSRWVNGKYVITLFFIAIAVMKERKLLAENLWVLYLSTDREPEKAFCY